VFLNPGSCKSQQLEVGEGAKPSLHLLPVEDFCDKPNEEIAGK
jgi:hypothetical protein